MRGHRLLFHSVINIILTCKAVIWNVFRELAFKSRLNLTLHFIYCCKLLGNSLNSVCVKIFLLNISKLKCSSGN